VQFVSSRLVPFGWSDQTGQERDSGKEVDGNTSFIKILYNHCSSSNTKRTTRRLNKAFARRTRPFWHVPLCSCLPEVAGVVLSLLYLHTLEEKVSLLSANSSALRLSRSIRPIMAAASHIVRPAISASTLRRSLRSSSCCTITSIAHRSFSSSSSASASSSPPSHHGIERAAVVGAGQMGLGIAYVTAKVS
jgi:hypothetical protein